MSSFPSPGAGPIVVVGGGTAGCVVARRLVDAGHHVVLVEAGPPQLSRSDGRLRGLDHLLAHDVADRWWPGTSARRTVRGEVAPYLLGRGLGGSSAVNGLMAEIDSSDPAVGPADEVRLAIERHLVPVESVRDEELGPLSAALLDTGLARVARLARRGPERADAGVAYLGDLVGPAGGAPEGQLDIVAGTTVDRVLDRSAGASVVTANGDRIAARAVVLSAGALHTPAILLRSNTTSQPLGAGEVGRHLQDHPSVALHVTIRPAARVGSAPVVTGAIARRDAIELLPLERVGGGAGAAILVALLTPIGAAGTVRLGSDDPLDPPVVDVRALDDPEDRRRLRNGVRWALSTLERQELAAVVEHVAVDDRGTAPEALASDESLDEWLMTSVGAYHHAAASCGLGRCLDDDARVLGTESVYVVDASAFPTIPRTGTHLPTVVLAERLTQRWLA